MFRLKIYCLLFATLLGVLMTPTDARSDGYICIDLRDRRHHKDFVLEELSRRIGGRPISGAYRLSPSSFVTVSDITEGCKNSASCMISLVIIDNDKTVERFRLPGSGKMIKKKSGISHFWFYALQTPDGEPFSFGHHYNDNTMVLTKKGGRDQKIFRWSDDFCS